MSRVTLTELSADLDEEHRSGHYTSTNSRALRPHIMGYLDDRGRPTVTVEIESGRLSLAELWRRANHELDLYLQTLRLKLLEPDAWLGRAKRLSRSNAGLASGKARRVKNAPLEDDIRAYLRKNNDAGPSELAKHLFAKHGRSRGDRVKDLRALARRISRILNDTK